MWIYWDAEVGKWVANYPDGSEILLKARSETQAVCEAEMWAEDEGVMWDE